MSEPRTPRRDSCRSGFQPKYFTRLLIGCLHSPRTSPTIHDRVESKPRHSPHYNTYLLDPTYPRIPPREGSQAKNQYSQRTQGPHGNPKLSQRTPQTRLRKVQSSQALPGPQPDQNTMKGHAAQSDEDSVTEPESDDAIFPLIHTISQSKSSQSSRRNALTLTVARGAQVDENSCIDPDDGLGPAAEEVSLTKTPSMPGIAPAGLRLSASMRDTLSQDAAEESHTEPESDDPDVEQTVTRSRQGFSKNSQMLQRPSRKHTTSLSTSRAQKKRAVSAARHSQSSSDSQSHADDEQSIVSDTPLRVPQESWDDTNLVTQSGDSYTESQLNALDPILRDFFNIFKRGPLVPSLTDER